MSIKYKIKLSKGYLKLKSMYNNFKYKEQIKTANNNFIIQENEHKENNKIRVGFITQYIPCWSKLSPVYRALVLDDRFEPYIICVPSNIDNHILIGNDKITNDTYEYFINHGYDAINAMIGEDEWFDLRTLNLDYLFYPRPYNSFMPRAYISDNVSLYTKICHMMYAMCINLEVISTLQNRDFFKNVYCYFAETQEAADMCRIMWNKAHKKGLRKTIFSGMPVYSEILEKKNEESEVWKFSKNDFRILWTPRWTTDTSLGGSNFFTYKESLIDYVEKNKNVDFVLRPHPLMFFNFINTGEMTKEEVEEYRKKIELLDRAYIDETKTYESTMWKSSVMITDVSSMMSEYFITGNPVILCDTNMYLHFTKFSTKLLEGFYIASNISQLSNILDDLQNGIDPLKEKRKKIIEELYGDTLKNSVNIIINELSKR